MVNNVSHNLLERAKRIGGVAYLHQHHQCTFDELDDRAHRTAQYLCQQGLRPRQIVLFIQDDSIDWAMIFHAVIMIGAVPVIINPKFGVDRFTTIAKKSNASLAVGQSRYINNLDIDTIVTDDLPWNNYPRYTEIYDFCANDEMMILTTSGTTGDCKLIVHGHDNIQHMFDLTNPHRFDQTSVILCPARMSFVYGLVMNVLGCLARNSTVVIIQVPDDLRKLDHIVNQHKVTHLFVGPHLLRIMIRKPMNFGSHLQYICSGGEPVPDTVFDEMQSLYNRPLYILYGLSETVRWGLIMNTPTKYRLHCLGLPSSDIETRIVDSVGQTVGIGEIGELQIKCSTLFFRYHGDPALTQKVLHDGWYSTRDLMYQDHEGYFFYAGRLDHSNKINGCHVNATDIEFQLQYNIGIEDSVVLFESDQHGFNKSVAFVIPGQRTDLTPHQMRAKLLASGTPSHLVPHEICFVESIPMTPTNKKIRNLQHLNKHANRI